MSAIRYETLYDIFKLFLEKHRGYDKFLANMRRGGSLYQLVNKLRMEPYELIHYAFKWQDTAEGFAYWSALDTKWRDIIDSLIGE